jgi:Protein kinase domain
VSQQPPSLPGEFAPGTLIAGYRVEERIGHGGMASVYRAFDTRLHRRVALKILTSGRHFDEAFRRRFIRESRAAAAVEDPHIIPVFDAGESDGVLYIAMRYVRGGDVRSQIDRYGPLPVGRVTEIVAQVASALDAAHAAGLVHRDVKPANMLLERSPVEARRDHVYLSDFGLSKTASEVSGLTASGQFLGTLDYVAPEQIRAQPVDGRADEYALACSSYEMLCGQPPFRREQDVSVMYAHLSEPAPSLRARRPELPVQVDEVMARALAKAPADRYATCGELAVALRQALDPAYGGNDAPLAGGGSPPADHPVTQIAVPPGSVPQPEQVPGAAALESGRQPGEPAPQPPVHTQPSARSVTRVGLTDPSAVQPVDLTGTPAAAGAVPRRRWWRSPAPVAAICAAALVVAGGAAYIADRGHPPRRTAGTVAAGSALNPPGCSTAVAPAPTDGVQPASVPVAGGPYSVAVAVHGLYDFVTAGTSIAMLRNGRNGAAPKLIRYIRLAGAAKGDVITRDNRFLLAAVGSGAVVINVMSAEQRAADPIEGTLTAPGGSLPGEVLATPNDDYAFVSLKGEVAVFSLTKALVTGFRHDFIGGVPIPGDPLGMASDGKWLYVVSHLASGQGTLSVIRLSEAETDPTHARVLSVPAGCYPARVLLSDNNRVVWVTARQSDALVGFSTAKLPRRLTLIAKVGVGAQPVGMTLVNATSILVADSGQSNLAVVRIAGVLTGRQPVLVGYVPTGSQPHQFARVPGSGTVLLTVQHADQLDAIDPGDLP